MAERQITVSIIGCLNNCIREYRNKMRVMRNLLEDEYVQDVIDDEIKEYLAEDINDDLNKVLEDFFDQEHGMIKIGTTLAEDLQKAKWGDFDKMEMLRAETEEEKAELKQVIDVLN